MRNFFLFCLAMTVSGGLYSQELEILNPSFEEPIATFTPGTPFGWKAFKPNDPGMWTENTQSTGMVGGEGSQHAGMNSFEAFIYQDLAEPFRSNAAYEVEVATAHRSNFPNGRLEFGLFSSLNIGEDVGVAGYSDLNGVWVGSGNPDADNLLNRFRDSAELDAVGSGSLAEPYRFVTSDLPPDGNVVVFLRIADQNDQNRRVQFDDVRVTVSVIGDVNCDGSIDLLDVVPFVNAVTGGEYEFKADINQDDSVDLFDVQPFVGLLTGA